MKVLDLQLHLIVELIFVDHQIVAIIADDCNKPCHSRYLEATEDFFYDMERPRFGWRVKVKLKENESCDIDFENPDQTTCEIGSKTENEELDELNSRHWKFFAESRQTDQGFRSAAPSDC